ncbi:MAG: ABC transporter permease [Desulfurococcaceae archaeon]
MLKSSLDIIKKNIIGKTAIFLRDKKSLLSITILLCIVMLSVMADYIAPYHFNEQDLARRLQPPSMIHVFGTDALGRDIFSRILYAGRVTLLLGVTITILTSIIGISFGLLSGYVGGLVDLIICKIAEIFWAFPTIVLALALAAVLGPSVENVILVLAILMWVPFTKVTRAKALVLREMPFIKYVKALGLNPFIIIGKHVFPNLISDIIVLFVLSIPDAMLTSAALSFLGLGVQPPTPEWGAMLADGRLYFTRAPWITIFPGMFLVLTALSLNILGDVLRDLTAPRLRG